MIPGGGEVALLRENLEHSLVDDFARDRPFTGADAAEVVVASTDGDIVHRAFGRGQPPLTAGVGEVGDGERLEVIRGKQNVGDSAGGGVGEADGTRDQNQ